jgi:hypothetical protein
LAAATGIVIFANRLARFWLWRNGSRAALGDVGDRPLSWISYMLDGKQYLTILARSNPNNRLFTFTLDGNETMPPLPPPAAGGGRGGAGRGNAPAPPTRQSY